MTRVNICTDCRGEFSYEYRRGAPRQRCDTCRVAHKKQQDTIKSQRWKDANRAHHVAYMRDWHQARKNDPEFRRRNRERMVTYKYGITQPELDALLEEQGHRCAICGGERNGPGTRLHIDHCHGSNRVRGLLCTKCNTAVGLLDDDPARAEALAAYLRR